MRSPLPLIPKPAPAASPRHAWLWFVVTFGVLTAWCLGRYSPPRANSLTLTLRLSTVSPRSGEPLIATGHAGAGDVLFIVFENQHAIRFGYDSWGHPIVFSTATVPVSPGEQLSLRIQLPSLQPNAGVHSPADSHLVVQCNGEPMIDRNVAFHSCPPSEVYFAENRIGSSWCAPALEGTLASRSGTVLRGPEDRVGSAGAEASLASRFIGWVRNRPDQLVAALLIGLVAYGATRRNGKGFPECGGWRKHRWFFVISGACVIAFVAAITNGTFRILAREPYGVFYDYQAASLLHGRLDVPEAAIGGEAFIAGGRYYGYFGPTPAILRLPLIVFDIGFGRLTRVFMLLEYVAALAASYALLREISHRLTNPEPSRFAVVALLANAGLGSTLLFLGDRGMMYHEAILCGATFALWSTWFSLRQLRIPGRRRWMGALLTAFAAVQARPTSGLFAVTLLGCILAYQAWQGIAPSSASAVGERDIRSNARLRAFGVICLAFVAALSFDAVGYLKFGTFDGAPLRLSRPYTPERLAAVNGKSFHAVNVPFGVYTYLVHANFRLEPHFPFLFIGAKTAGAQFPEAKIDLPDYTLAMPWAMPGLAVLATFGAAVGFLRHHGLRPAIALVSIAVLPMAIALFAAIAIAQRYTADFCPWLIVMAAFGLVALDSAPQPIGRVGRTIVGASTIAAILVTTALVLDYQGNWAPNQPPGIQERYQRAFHRIDSLIGLH